MIPIEYDSMRSIVIRRIDKVINDYTDQEVIESINNANIWAEVEQIHQMVDSSKLSLTPKRRAKGKFHYPTARGDFQKA